MQYFARRKGLLARLRTSVDKRAVSPPRTQERACTRATKVARFMTDAEVAEVALTIQFETPQRALSVETSHAFGIIEKAD